MSLQRVFRVIQSLSIVQTESSTRTGWPAIDKDIGRRYVSSVRVSDRCTVCNGEL